MGSAKNRSATRHQRSDDVEILPLRNRSRRGHRAGRVEQGDSQESETRSYASGTDGARERAERRRDQQRAAGRLSAAVRQARRARSAAGAEEGTEDRQERARESRGEDAGREQPIRSVADHAHNPVELWDLSCKDWQQRIREGRSLVPTLPLYQEEARIGLAFFEALRLTDVLDEPLLKNACGDWFKDIVKALFGSLDPATNFRYIREIFAMVPKGNSKTTYSAALMIVALLMARRRNVEFLFLAPTQAISDLAYDAAKSMVEAEPELMKRFHIRAHKKDIYDRVTKNKLKVKTFGLNVMTGPKPAGVLIDEIHLLGRFPYTAKVLRQVRGGMEKNTDGFVMFITTQSDDIPVGAFSDELKIARAIRDGKMQGRMLPVLYEFPDDIAKRQELWEEPKNWHMVMPNLGRSLQLDSLVQDFKTEKAKGKSALQLWASQHLNIQIGLGLKNDGWIGAQYYEKQIDSSLTLETLVERSEVIVAGVDGGGLDDLFSVRFVGRDAATGHWLSVGQSWADKGMLEARQSIASTLKGFEQEGCLTIVDDALSDLQGIVELIEYVKDSGKLFCVAVDPAGLGELVEELKKIDITVEGEVKLIGVAQGYALMNAIKTSERKLKNGTLWMGSSGLGVWCAGNLKIEPTATAIRASKQNVGDAKIDDIMALFDAVSIMVKDPAPPAGRSYLEEENVMVL